MPPEVGFVVIPFHSGRLLLTGALAKSHVSSPPALSHLYPIVSTVFRCSPISRLSVCLRVSLSDWGVGPAGLATSRLGPPRVPTDGRHRPLWRRLDRPLCHLPPPAGPQ